MYVMFQFVVATSDSVSITPRAATSARTAPMADAAAISVHTCLHANALTTASASARSAAADVQACHAHTRTLIVPLRIKHRVAKKPKSGVNRDGERVRLVL